jgi:shikimate kinase
MNIFLVGFMGSGKSSLGKKLASRLNRPFVDLDKLIEEKEGISISAIFTFKGEEYFRNLEKKILHELPSDLNAVISLGGGASCNEDSLHFIKESGLSIYLKEKVDVLYGRLKLNKVNRPLIAQLDDKALKEFITEKLEERSVFYERAHFIYEKDRTSFTFLVKQIEDYLK